ncbi:uncharacterized protein LOC132601264 [Lycium barbarum]|uniref:uncharacterized protein LOC132601264 n=1 Tax=Lycium barbarum TaxID=112863 RepID=UPI00293EE78E|nr:uncharacterized protein LOC132601264 [Lycium barbarum]
MLSRLNSIAPGWKILANYQQAINGRIWFMWDPNWFDVSLSHATAQQIHCTVRDKSSDEQLVITVVYGFNTGDLRKTLWQDMNIVAQGLFGNPVTLQEIHDFSECIQHIDVHELPWQGEYYTWSNKQQGSQRITSRIDIIFGTYEWMLKWGQVSTLYDLPFISDHAPMMIKLQQQQRPKYIPFKFFNIWVDHENFLQIVSDNWQVDKATNRMQNVWLKLKVLQPALRLLNTQEFKFIRQKIDQTKEELVVLQEELAKQADANLIQQEKKALLNLEKWSLIEGSALKQKSKVKWVKLGDSNNKYFSAVCKERNHRNQILEITSLAGTKLHDPETIKEEFVMFYKGLRGSSVSMLPAVCKTTMRKGPRLSQQQRMALCAEVTKEDIYDALKAIGDDKAPGRNISDNIILAHELVKGYSRKHISARCMIKIDLQKAYDSVEWIYLEQVMTKLGFPHVFTTWVLDCVKFVSYSIIVNGERTTAFPVAKGLRQGDPIPPFLFAIAMEFLSRSLNSLKTIKSIKFHPQCGKLGVTHLCFADDLLMFSKGDLNSILAMQQCFLNFSAASGLQENLGKSSIYFGGVSQDIRSQILQQLGFSLGELPFKYLGIPLSSKKLTIMQWYPLIERITTKISTWTTKKLSYAGRVQLVQSVLFRVQAYWSQLFMIPAKNQAAITKLCWDLAHKEDKLWVKWIHAYYIKDQQLSVCPIPQIASWMTRKIVAARGVIEQQNTPPSPGK